MNIMVILYDGNSIDNKQGVMQAIAEVLNNNLGTVKVKFITPETADFIESTTSHVDALNQEAIDNAIVLVSEYGEIRTSSLAEFSSLLTLNVMRGHKELINALFILNELDSITGITKEVRQKYRFSNHHLAACKAVFARAVH